MGSSVVVVLVGLPAAGKTTFSKLCKNYLQDNAEYVVTNFHYDDLCKTFSSADRKSVLSKVEEFLSEETNKKNVIIIDDNNYYKSMRYEYVKLCKKYNLGFLIMHLKISLEKSIQRNLFRISNHQVSETVIREMNNKLEIPMGDSVIYVEDFDHIDFDFNYIQKKIEEVSNNPLKQLETSEVVPMSKSDLQIVDLALRKIVHNHILQDKSRGKACNNLKKDLYLKICSGEIVISAFMEYNRENLSDDNFESLLESELKQHFLDFVFNK